MFERLHQIRGRQCVIKDERNAVFMCDIRYSLDIQGIEARISYCLGENRFGALINSRAEILGIAAVDKSNGDAKLRERVVEQVIRATIQTGRANDFVTCTGDVENSQCFSRLAGSCCQCANASFESRYTAFKCVLGGIHDTCIDVSKLPKPEEVRCMFGTIKDIRG